MWQIVSGVAALLFAICLAVSIRRGVEFQRILDPLYAVEAAVGGVSLILPAPSFSWPQRLGTAAASLVMAFAAGVIHERRERAISSAPMLREWPSRPASPDSVAPVE